MTEVPAFSKLADTDPVEDARRKHLLRRAWLLVVGSSVAVRMVALLLMRHVPVASDARDYLDMARQIASGHPFLPYWPPGVPLLLKPLVALGASEWVMRAETLVFWILCCGAFYLLMEALGCLAAGWKALLIFSILPDSVQMAIEPMTQMPAAALLVLAMASSMRLLQGTARRVEPWLLGGTLGMLTLVRPSTAPLTLAIPVGLALLSGRLYPSIATLTTAVLLVGAWVGYVHAMTGRAVINTANATNLFYGNNPWTPDYKTWYFGSHAKPGTEEIQQYPAYAEELSAVEALPEAERPGAFAKLAEGYIEAHPARFVWRSANRVRAFLGFDIFTSAALSHSRVLGFPVMGITLPLEALTYLLLALPAVFFLAAVDGVFWRTGPAILLGGTMVLYATPYWVSMSHPTYHFPLLLVLAALGAAAQAHRGPSGSLLRWRGWIAVAALLCVQAEWLWNLADRAGM